MKYLRPVLFVLAGVVAAALLSPAVESQAAFLVFGSASGVSQVVKSTSNALWVSVQTGSALPGGGLFFPSQAVGDIIYANATTTFTRLADVAAGSQLCSGGVNTAPLYCQNALVQVQPADQTARSSSGGTFVMMGLGAAAAPCTITPASTGRVIFEINGDLVNNTTATTVTIKMAENTGSAPANNAAATGNVITIGKVIDGLTSDLTAAFHLVGTKTGLALSTAVWFDLQLTTSGANTGQPTNVDCIAHEI